MAYVPPVDLSKATEETVKQLYQIMARGSSFAPRLAMVLLNIDKLDPKLLDTLLKTIEEPGRNVTLVLTASRMSAVRVAIRSRSRTLQLRKLTASESRQFVRSRLHDVPADLVDKLLPAVCDHGRGLPRTLDHICHSILAHTNRPITEIDTIGAAGFLRREADCSEKSSADRLGRLTLSEHAQTFNPDGN